MTIKCHDCGRTDASVYHGRGGKYYCYKCKEKHVKTTTPEILKSALTCPFCGIIHEFDGPPVLGKCSCGATVEWRSDDYYTFEVWD